MNGCPTGPSAWSVERFTGSAADLHARELPASASRVAWCMRVARPALALGSTQPALHVDAGRAAQAGVEIVRRRSGGGAVLLRPDDPVWIDLVVPAGDPLWVDDVGRSAWWVGETWRRALAALGADAARLEVHRAPSARTAWSDRVCFAGVGPGEVTWRGRKVVGISQRRTRSAARFQCGALLQWTPSSLVDLLAVDEPTRRMAVEALAVVAAGVGEVLAPSSGDVAGQRPPDGGPTLRDRLEAAFLAALPVSGGDRAGQI